MNQLCRSEQGFSLLEVMVAMVVMAFSMLGVLGMFQWGDHGLRQGAMGTHALAMAQSRIEAKRAVSWEALLTDDLNLDGIPDVVMRDDGLQEDRVIILDERHQIHVGLSSDDENALAAVTFWVRCGRRFLRTRCRAPS